RTDSLNWGQFEAVDWSASRPGIEAIGGEFGWRFLVRAGGANRQSRGSFVTGTFFPIFGTVPAAGRLIGPLDDRPDAPPVAVISYGFWMRHFGGNTAIIGSPLDVGTTTVTIVGVAPEGFLGTGIADLGQGADDRIDLWLPMAMTATWTGFPRVTRTADVGTPEPIVKSPNASIRIAASGYPNMVGPAMVARLAPGVDREDAEAQMQAFVPSLQPASNRPVRRLVLRPFMVMTLDDSAELATMYGALFFVPFLVLLIGCANVAGLQHARASWRRHELAVRTSLGASRGRLARLLMVEVFVTAAAASLLAWALTTWLLRFTANVFPFHAQADWRVFVFALGLPALITLLIGLVPSWRAAGIDVVSGLKTGSRDGQQGQWRLGRIAVVTQIGLSVVLVFAAVMLSRGVSRALESGAAPHDVVTASFYFGDTDLTPDAQRAAVQSVIRQARDIAGPDNVAVRSFGSGRATIGERGQGSHPSGWIGASAATSAIFDLLDLRVAAGRIFRDGEQNVMVVNEAFAQRFDSLDRIVGESFDVTTDAETPSTAQGVIPTRRRVIGVVQNETPTRPSQDPGPTLYVPLKTDGLRQVTILLRATDPLGAKHQLRMAAAAIYPTLVPRPLATLEELRQQQYQSMRWLAQAFSAVGSLALILAAVGLFALVSAAVSQRTREFGVRLALGAEPSAVIALVIRDVIKVAAIGVIAGLVLSVPLSLLLRSAFVRETTLADPSGLALGLAVMLAAIIAAAWLPARRAARVDPLLALRAE
ncbi:MAG: FtsX-like permease family protein, partial [Vicinamibacterales bacterium]